MKCRQLAGWLALLCMTAATGCGPGDGETRQTADTAIRASAAAAAADPAANPAAAPAADGRPAKKPPKRPKRLALPGQLVLHPGGGGRGPDCISDLAELPPRFATSPAVWLSGMSGPKKLLLALPVALCLHGFATDRPVRVTVTVGGHRYRTTVTPAAGTLTLNRFQPAETLFNGARLPVYSEGRGVLASDEWGFVPPSRARDSIVAAGRITTAAAQGRTSASYQQRAVLPGIPGQDWIPGQHRHRLVIFGFPQGQQVPVGLYRKARRGQNLVLLLVRRIGAVTMPRSRIAVFTLPRKVTETGEQYCASAPVTTQTSCPGL